MSLASCRIPSTQSPQVGDNKVTTLHACGTLFLRNAPIGHSSWLRWDDTPAAAPLASPALATATPPPVIVRQSTQGVGTSSSHLAPPPVTTTRSDAPIVKHARRGSATAVQDALDTLGPTQGMATLIDDLAGDKYAKTTTGPNASLIKTWTKYHGLAFASVNPVPPVLPITPQAIVAVGALFKRGGYRSFANYASVMKGRHIEAEHKWCQMLSHTANWVTRSVNRGLGPPRQSCGFDFAKLCSLPRSEAPLVDNGPQHPAVMAILGCIFLLREIELSTARTDAWTLNYETSELAWNLPASKSDHMALGVSRSWPCLCELPDFACPFHLAVAHMTWVREQPNFVEGISSPLFPTLRGQHASKDKVVETFECLAARTGQPLHTADGMRRYGGHTARVTGARTFAELGVEIKKIGILARHSGDTIMRYVSEAPLRSLMADLGLAKPGMAPRTPARGGAAPRTPALCAPAPSTPITVGISRQPAMDSMLAARVRKLEAAFSKMELDLNAQAQDVVGIVTGLARDDRRVFIQNTYTSTIHFARSNDDGHTSCGWRFATARSTYRVVQSLRQLPSTMLCEKCLPTERLMAANLVEVELSGDEGIIREVDVPSLAVL